MEDFEFDMDLDALFISETWVMQEVQLPQCLAENFGLLQSPALRDKSRGRGSGGLAILYRKCYDVVLLDSSAWWIVCLFNLEGVSFIVCSVYFKPFKKCEELGELLSLFQLTLDDLRERYREAPIFVGGDFNCRIGSAGEIPEELVSGTNLFDSRTSMDETITGKGRDLLDFMFLNSMTVINGRTSLDRPAQFTYSGPSGDSVVDLVWCGNHCLSLINNFQVMEHPTASDHSPVLLTLAMGANRTAVVPTASALRQRLRWNCSLAQGYVESMRYSSDVAGWGSIEDMHMNLCSAIKENAGRLGMLKTLKSRSDNLNRKPWYDNECLVARRELRLSLRECRRQKFSAFFRTQYVESRKRYKKMLLYKKNTYMESKIAGLCDVKNQLVFWRTFNALNVGRARGNPSHLTVEDWETFYSHVGGLTFGVPQPTTVSDVLDPILDGDISLDEIGASLLACKDGKAPGSDGVPSEFYKCLPQNWLLYLCGLFNKVLRQEVVPSQWRETILVMVHKKGPLDDPVNYRGIALLNCIEKVFSQTLLHRLQIWVDENQALPECQSGFRKSRGCVDNVFALSSIIHINLRLSRRKVYVAFVDFRRAFDSINHLLLWNKLHTLGISSKFIGLVKGIYTGATMRVRVGDRLTKRFEITCGVLQGEPLSPLLFSLFLSDIEAYFRERGAVGVNLDNSVDVLMLLYADDLAILSDSPIDLNRKLAILHQYASANGLEVNTSKTKIMCFRKGGFNADLGFTFRYAGEPLEVVSDYNYLGVKFSQSSLFLGMTTSAVSRAKQSSGAVVGLMAAAKVNAWDTRVKLYESVVLATIAHCVSVWGLRYSDMLERIQVQYFKRILQLPWNTPDHIVRLEVGAVQLRLYLFKHALSWLKRLLSMDHTRIPWRCFARLRQLDLPDKRYNWCAQIRELFIYVDQMELYNDLQLSTLRRSERSLLEKFKSKLISEDQQRLATSAYPILYGHLLLSPSCQDYLLMGMPLAVQRVIAQVRTTPGSLLRIAYKGIMYKINTTEYCTICNKFEIESLEHVLFSCPVYCEVRPDVVKAIGDLAGLVAFFNDSTKERLEILFSYIVSALKIRSFILNE